jgi:tetratricopeptide (TPR) repeat protein
LTAYLALPVNLWGQDKEALRQALRLPTASAITNFKVDSLSGLVMWGDKPDYPGDIAAARKSLRGDAGDAERFSHLAGLYAAAGDEAQEQAARTKAIALYREQLKARPNDPDVLRGLAGSLDPQSAQEAERLFRRATEIAPKEWCAWTDLADSLNMEGTWLLFPEGTPRKFMSLEAMAAILAEHPPEPQAESQGLRQLDESLACYDKAVAAAPRDPGPYSSRGFARMGQDFLRQSLRAIKGERVNPFLAAFSPLTMADIHRSAELSPRDFRNVARVAITEVMAALLRCDNHDTQGCWERFPEDARRSIRTWLDRLDHLAEDSDPMTAAGSAEALGMLEAFIMQDLAQAEKHYRRVVALRPSREEGWEMLMGLLGATRHDDDLLAVAIDRVKRKDCAHNRFLLAKAYERHKELPKAEDQLRLAIVQDPKDVLVTLGLAALTLKHAKDPKAIAEAGKLLDQSERLLGVGGSATERLDLQATRGVWLALNGRIEEARGVLRDVLALNRDHETAKPALKALGE